MTRVPIPRPTAHRLLVGLLAAALALPATAACAPVEDTAGADGGPSDGGADGKDAKKKKTAGIGDEVRDGKFAFTVTKVKRGVKRLGSGPLASDAQGEFVLIYVTVRNIGKKGQLFHDAAQTLVDADGREYDAASGEAAVSLGESNAFLKDINPGNHVKGILVYDVPKKTRLKSLELHDSPFSGGVKVSLAKA
ncbi:DUF4352 domain-containing protein [Thermomonospora umbrina]|uniref:Uncharacterized protein DUF4352 n=1 Tax=Thermomonospora umbrina TaxID=111806 RepID=A0A3D9SXG3_9ACTN|nr:DUF4352 domain-containing protein [Thermomonospora umbrina]REE96291.1 uncharacterized protein DUF4352 [Thermomonospora umbrina]